MNSALYIKLIFISILMLVSTSAIAQNSFNIQVCSHTSRDGSGELLCGYGDTREEAAGELCVISYGFRSSVSLLENAAIGFARCDDVRGDPTGFARCRLSSINCNSIPPATPLESFHYKPFDSTERLSPDSCGTCACEGEQWTLVRSPGLVGCLAPKPIKDEPDDNCVGNPCNPSNGHKYAGETDFSNGALSFIRYYSTGNLSDYGLGMGWTSNHHQRLVMGENGDELTQVSSNGRGEPWRKVNNTWVGDADSDILLEQVGTEYKVTMANGEAENYGPSGLLLSKVDTNGLVTSYHYNDDQRLERVTNHYGNSISFTYELGRILTVTDPDGAVYTYEYNRVRLRAQTLIAVVYPDSTPADNTDNQRRQYLYRDEGIFPRLSKLVGIIDENDDRYAVYRYDAEGRAILTSHAATTNRNGQQRFTLEYQ